MKLIDLLEIIHPDSFISVRWQHNSDYEYQGVKCNFYKYSDDEDVIVKSIKDDSDKGIILVIDTKE